MASPTSKRTTMMMKEDPVYQELMKGSGSNASHNYYQEFRLGQGDPLMKASMKQWGPNTTVYNNEEPPKPPRTTCTTLSNPMSGRRGTWPGANPCVKQVPYDPTSDYYCEYLVEDAS